jgi:putative Holliday junction resolvase
VGRIISFDVGKKRIGIAVSDGTATLARPVGVLPSRALEAAVDDAVKELQRLAGEGDEIDTIVVGHPRRLDGSPNDMTMVAEAFAARLREQTGLTVVLQDERLSSREAESRLALRDRDWRSRKRRLDAAAAAVILQDYLDSRPGRLIPTADDPEF